MHLVTKVLVVAAAVLALLLAALTSAYAVNADRIVSSLSSERALRTQADVELRAAQSQAAEQAQRLKQQIDALNSDIAARDTQLRQLQSENAQLRRDTLSAKDAADAVTRQIGQFGQTIQTQVALIESYRNEITGLREGELQWRRREIQLVDRVNDLESQREVLEQGMRSLQEQLVQLRDSIQGGGAVAAGAVGGPTTAGLIRARVIEIRKDPSTNALLAQIDVGSEDAVRPGMELFIARGSDFLGKLVITSTDLQQAVGRIDTLGRKVEVKPGDAVMSSLQ